MLIECNMKDREKYLVLITLLIGLFCVPIYSQETQKETILRQISNTFGSSVDPELGLYDVNRSYVLKVDFDKTNSLQKLSVSPKYYFDKKHPEWAQTSEDRDLTLSEYNSLRNILISLAPLGKLLEPPPNILLVTNSTAWAPEKYEKGVLTTGFLEDLVERQPDEREIRWFRIQYGKAALDQYDKQFANDLPEIEFDFSATDKPANTGH